MSLEVKLGGLNMDLFGRKKKNKDEHSEDGMSRREFLKKTGIAAAGAYLGANVFGGSEALAGGNPEAPPMAIRVDPDVCIPMAWNAIKTGRGHSMYNLNSHEYARAILKLDGQGHVGMQFKKVDDITPETSHAYYLLAAKLNRCSDFLIEKNLSENVSLNMFANGLKNMFGMTSHDRNNYRAAEFFAKGIFAAGMYDKSNSEAIGKASEFMESDVRGKELMLREIYESNFKKFSANPQSRNVKSVEYKMLSFYWNLGFYILAENLKGNKEIRFIDRFPNGNTIYGNLHDTFKFDTANGKLIK